MRNLEGYSLQREKLASLGTMAAGLAHELNNPAAAEQRAVAHLQQTTNDVQSLLCQLSRSLDKNQTEHLEAASNDAVERVASAPQPDHLERSDRAHNPLGPSEIARSAAAGEYIVTILNILQ